LSKTTTILTFIQSKKASDCGRLNREQMEKMLPSYNRFEPATVTFWDYSKGGVDTTSEYLVKIGYPMRNY
jgi:hypothetical protein